jgi:enediyne biosynthesis protein E4
VRSCCVIIVLLCAACSRPERGSAPSTTELFREIAEESGLRFRHFTGATGRYYLPEIMGAGCALFDYDSDGDLDVYVVQGGILEPATAAIEALFPLPDRHPAGNRLFRNELLPSGKLRFTDVTEGSGAGVKGYGMGVAVGDYDNDGRPDLYVTNFGENVLLHNDGNGTFKDVTRAVRAGDPRWSTGAAFFDYDRDGPLGEAALVGAGGDQEGIMNGEGGKHMVCD